MQQDKEDKAGWVGNCFLGKRCGLPLSWGVGTGSLHVFCKHCHESGLLLLSTHGSSASSGMSRVEEFGAGGWGPQLRLSRAALRGDQGTTLWLKPCKYWQLKSNQSWLTATQPRTWPLGAPQNMPPPYIWCYGTNAIASLLTYDLCNALGPFRAVPEP